MVTFEDKVRRILFFMTALLFGAVLLTAPLPAGAEPVLEEGDLDPAAIHCKDYPKNSSTLDACKSGWSGGEDACKEIFGGDHATCLAAAQAKDKAGPTDQTICNHNFPHTPGSNSIDERKFKACLDGYRKGDAECSSINTDGLSDIDKQAILDACLVGNQGNASANGPQPGASNAASETTNRIGPAPTSASITSVQPPQGQRHNPSACSLSGFMGDLMCDGTAAVGQMADSALAMLGAFMKLPPLQFDTSNPLYMYWQSFRNIANILFIIVFLIVIYSHLTSLGLSNYSVKRIIPRLAAAALLVNMSFYICALFVDISNIIGSTVYGTVGDLILTATSDKTGDALQTELSSAPNAATSTFTWSTIATAALAAYPGTKAFVAWGGFAALLPILITVVLAVVITVISLLLRQVLIILLIAISPLAFVSIVLPNTKSYFDRWWRSFVPLLMLYPAIALLFAAGTVASSILAYSVSGSDYPEKLFFFLMAMGMQIVPLLLVPKVMQLGGGMLASFAGASNRKTAGIRKAGNTASQRLKRQGDMKAVAKQAENPDKKGISSWRANRAHRRLRNEKLKEALEKKQEQHGIDIDRKNNNKEAEQATGRQDPDFITDSPDTHTLVDDRAEGEATEGESEVITAEHDPQKMPSADQKRSQTAYQQARITADKVNATAKSYELNNTSYSDLLNYASSGDDIAAMAAAKTLVKDRGDDDAAFNIMKSSTGSSNAVMSNLVSNIQENSGLSNNPILGVPAVQDNIRKKIIHKENFHVTATIPAINARGSETSEEDMAGYSKATMSLFAEALIQESRLPANERNVDVQSARDFIETASNIKNIPKYNDKVKDSRKSIEAISRLRGVF